MYMPQSLILGTVVIKLSSQAMFVSSVALFFVLNWM